MQAEIILSGNPVADRFAAHADMMVAQHRPGEAIASLRTALALAPGWTAAWVRLGDLLQEIGDSDAAAEAWRRALEQDPGDRLGAGLRLDRLSPRPVTETLPPAFVEMLFDQYADRFDTVLPGALGYRGPDLIVQALDAAGIGMVERAMDLGCGTGLSGAALRPRCHWLGGIDLSAAMLQRARAKGLYDHLERRDIAKLTVEAGRRYDLIVAADVFIYVGALERVLAWCAGSLMPDGAVAFTLERGDAPLVLHARKRFAHSLDYAEAVLRAAGFTRIEAREGILRHEDGHAVEGLTMVATGLAPSRPRVPARSRDARPARAAVPSAVPAWFAMRHEAGPQAATSPAQAHRPEASAPR